VRGLDGAAVGKLGSYAGDCGPFVCEWCVGGNEMSSCAGVKDGRRFFAGRKHNLIQFEYVLISFVLD
jgi:hypothetical protein